MADHDYRTPSVATFLERLAGSEPTPGGGAAAAVAGAMGASLVRMLARLSLGRTKHERDEALMQAILDQATEEEQTLLDLASQDAAAYDEVGAALALPRGSDAEKAARKAALQTALAGACEVPLRIMEHSLEVIGLAKNAVLSGNRNAASDGASGAELARAALKAASYNVKINLASIDDEGYAKVTRARVDEMFYMGTAAAHTVDAHVEDLWQPAEAPADANQP